MGVKGLKIIMVTAFVVLIGVVGTMLFLAWDNPYAITAGDKTIALVNSEKAGDKVIEQVMKDYQPEDSDIKKLKIDKTLDVNKTSLGDAEASLEPMSVKDAVAFIEKHNEGDKPFFTATIVGKTVNDEEYAPETQYIKEDEMIAGIPQVEVEEVKGLQRVTRKVTTTNGVVTDTEVTNTKILKEGTAAVIHKGTVGLPEGEDWRTFEGDPVFAGADDLIVIAKKYLGVPYKYGGYSLDTGVDCVQYVRQIFKKYGIYIPDHHSGIRKSGVGVSYANMQKGDVICYSHHVAIYMGDGKIIHANRGTGVTISKVYKGQKIVTIRRIIK